MPSAITDPLVVSMGRTSHQHVEEFRQGGGPIGEEVGEVMRLVRERIGTRGGNRVLVPIVVIYTEKP